jgi:hypothetical protein
MVHPEQDAEILGAATGAINEIAMIQALGKIPQGTGPSSGCTCPAFDPHAFRSSGIDKAAGGGKKSLSLLP